MTAYTVIPAGDRDSDSPLTTGLVNKMVDNPIAISEGTSPAPKIQEAALDAAIVSQAKLKTTTGEVTTTSAVLTAFILPGGTYGFYPQQKYSTATLVTLEAFLENSGSNTASTSFLTEITIAEDQTGTYTIQQRYIQASPPYDLGDGEIPLFIFAEVDSGGQVITAYEAPEAPWHYNGPTDIRADVNRNGILFQTVKDTTEIDAALVAAGHPAGTTLLSARQLSAAAFSDYIEAFAAAKTTERPITQAIKNADMALIPRPMEPAAGNTVVMLDPVSDLTARLFEMKKHQAFSVLELLHDGDLVVSNTVLNRAGPPGVDIVSYRLR